MNKVLAILNLILTALFFSWAANNLATSHQCNEKLETAEADAVVLPQLGQHADLEGYIEAFSPTFGWVEAPLNVSLRMAWQAILEKDGPDRAEEFLAACRENLGANQGELAPVVAAIRYAENGGEGREYGVLHPRVKPTYRSQAGWAAATVQKNYDRWDGSKSALGFVEFLGSRYCPVGADNDPNGLNSHWVTNVTHWVTKIWNSQEWELRLRDPLTGATRPL